jgi:hypothetical protein
VPHAEPYAIPETLNRPFLIGRYSVDVAFPNERPLGNEHSGGKISRVVAYRLLIA